ncbi:hypothetical protein CHS0354_025495 [Potamilus streckersoni]|uniref:Uncharacterized protein n=1 Tax=Potamilus streckersoni TaxID=2493646 RepID=A0AAE0T5P2_9BIVA|nr:hypothetical protein CHS0354_025495 [Potamilus streckersoni]
MAALSQDIIEISQDKDANLTLSNNSNGPATYSGKGKQPLSGPPRVNKTSHNVTPTDNNKHTNVTTIDQMQMQNNPNYEEQILVDRQDKSKRQANNEEQSQAKCPKIEQKSQQDSTSTTSETQTIRETGPQPKHKLQPHPRIGGYIVSQEYTY